MTVKESQLPSYLQLKTANKRKKLIPEPNGAFLDVKCKECSNTSIIYTHSQTKIACKGCGYVLITPSGGKGLLGENILFRPFGKKRN
ncbi:hypothetical protein H312_03228 [Anncaliia algerae PRA339]|uniref:40S ribosomal protein S27 n=1 Tax=Anncaliia algerae PRA339 TaxID=1288291 RepID=A0A059EXA9_9MICR|nr:hypothetical protein H312_03228 [Anncaliia algerae PRA339]